MLNINLATTTNEITTISLLVTIIKVHVCVSRVQNVTFFVAVSFISLELCMSTVESIPLYG